MAYYSPADILFYGGSAGGGKTELLLGLSHTAHQRSIIFRRTNKQLRGIEDRAIELFYRLGKYNRSDMIWRFFDGRQIEFAGVELEVDKEKFQGRPHDFKCVGIDTPIRMGDGTYKPIQEICVGDLVATLEGVRKVTKVFPSRFDFSVKVDCLDCNGDIIFSQVQSYDHHLLTSAGDWDSYDNFYLDVSASDPFELCASILIHFDELCAEQLLQTYQSFLQHLAKIPLGLRRMIKRLQLLLGRQCLLEICAGAVLLNDRIDFLASAYQLLKDVQHFLESDHQEHLQPFAQLNALKYFRHFFCRDMTCEHGKSLLEDYQENYLNDSRQYDARTPELYSQYAGRAFVRLYPQQLSDVGQHNPTHFEDDDPDKAQIYNRREQVYVHPYRMDIRQIQVDTTSCSIKYTPVGIVQLFDIEVEDANHYITGAAGLVNKNCFDEITHFTRSQFEYISTWTRSATPGQRSRIICTGNPPTSAEGDWVIDYFAPWLDEHHHNPAEPGELRWYTSIDGKEKEVPNGKPFEVSGQLVYPKSRTFIPASIDDNPYLSQSGYKATLQALPKELREKFLDGKFTSSREDNPWQVIPSAWVQAAQARWRNRQKPNVPCSCIGVDVARGGDDQTILSKRYLNWFAEQQVHPGETTPNGPMVAALVMAEIERGTTINVDVIGVGSSVYDQLRIFNLNAFPINSSTTNEHLDRTGLLSFYNLRAEMYWRMREALDPETGYELALPDDRQLLADLTAPRWKLTARGIQVEPKDDIKKRIGRSPDKGDSIVYANYIADNTIAYDVF